MSKQVRSGANLNANYAPAVKASPKVAAPGKLGRSSKAPKGK